MTSRTPILDDLISFLETSIKRKAAYIRKIKYPLGLLNSLIELKELIGNTSIKESVAEQVTYILYEKLTGINQDNVMLHTIIEGPPGVGKSSIAEVLAKVYSCMGYLEDSSNTEGNKTSETFTSYIKSSGVDMTTFAPFIIYVITMILIGLKSLYGYVYQSFGLIYTIILTLVLAYVIYVVYLYTSSSSAPSSTMTSSSSSSKPPKDEIIGDGSLPPLDKIYMKTSRADFIAKYLGHSDKKTLEVLEKAKGKVLFIDEAYSLCKGDKDMYGKEVVDTLVNYMTDHPRSVIIILGGYADDLENSILSANKGFARRFMYRFTSDGYTGDELFDIFKKQLNKTGWKIHKEDVDKVKKEFSSNKDAFLNYGGDTERLTYFSKLDRSRSVLKGEKMDRRIRHSNIKKGIDRLLMLNEKSAASRKASSSNGKDELDMIRNLFANGIPTSA